MRVINPHMYVWICIYIVFMDACNFQGAYIPKTANIIACAGTQVALLRFLTSLLLNMLYFQIPLCVFLSVCLNFMLIMDIH